MSKELEALSHLETMMQGNDAVGYYRHFVSSSDEFRKDLATIKKAIERNEPMKPSMTDSGYFACVCSKRLHLYDNYCSQCGQAIDWSDEK